MNIPFSKMSGSGNDFVVIDNRGENAIRDDDKSHFTRKICAPKTGVGADGVLFLENSDEADFRMRYFNKDGGEAEFCGNGARCSAHFAHRRLGFPKILAFESKSGLITATVEGDTVRILMPRASQLSGPSSLELPEGNIEYYFINTGVPHTVILVENLGNFPVEFLGNSIRWHKTFAPQGTNADFVELCGANCDLKIRTFERGVEAETLACGTGVTAAAIVAVWLGLCDFPVKVEVALPDVLVVDMDGDRPTLEGAVRELFTGNFFFG